MTGTSRNSPEEIQYILDLHRDGLKRNEIAQKCQQKFKHRERTAESVGYIWNQYKDRPEYAPGSVHTAPESASANLAPLAGPSHSSSILSSLAGHSQKMSSGSRVRPEALANPPRLFRSHQSPGQYHSQPSSPSPVSVEAARAFGTGYNLNEGESSTVSTSDILIDPKLSSSGSVSSTSRNQQASDHAPNISPSSFLIANQQLEAPRPARFLPNPAQSRGHTQADMRRPTEKFEVPLGSAFPRTGSLWERRRRMQEHKNPTLKPSPLFQVRTPTESLKVSPSPLTSERQNIGSPKRKVDEMATENETEYESAKRSKTSLPMDQVEMQIEQSLSHKIMFDAATPVHGDKTEVLDVENFDQRDLAGKTISPEIASLQDNAEKNTNSLFNSPSSVKPSSSQQQQQQQQNQSLLSFSQPDSPESTITAADMPNKRIAIGKRAHGSGQHPTATRKAGVGLYNDPIDSDEQPLTSDNEDPRPRCQRCVQKKHGCDRKRPCNKCSAAGLGPDDCVPENAKQYVCQRARPEDAPAQPNASSSTPHFIPTSMPVTRATRSSNHVGAPSEDVSYLHGSGTQASSSTTAPGAQGSNISGSTRRPLTGFERVHNPLNLYRSGAASSNSRHTFPALSRSDVSFYGRSYPSFTAAAQSLGLQGAQGAMGDALYTPSVLPSRPAPPSRGQPRRPTTPPSFFAQLGDMDGGEVSEWDVFLNESLSEEQLASNASLDEQIFQQMSGNATRSNTVAPFPLEPELVPADENVAGNGGSGVVLEGPFAGAGTMDSAGNGGFGNFDHGACEGYIDQHGELQFDTYDISYGGNFMDGGGMSAGNYWDQQPEYNNAEASNLLGEQAGNPNAGELGDAAVPEYGNGLIWDENWGLIPGPNFVPGNPIIDEAMFGLPPPHLAPSPEPYDPVAVYEANLREAAEQKYRG